MGTQGTQAGGTGSRGSKGRQQQQQRKADAGASAVNSETVEQFAGLLKHVLMDGARPQAPQQQQQQQQVFRGQWLMTHGGQVVGLQGCRQVLLRLVMEPCLADKWQALAEVMG